MTWRSQLSASPELQGPKWKSFFFFSFPEAVRGSQFVKWGLFICLRQLCYCFTASKHPKTSTSASKV